MSTVAEGTWIQSCIYCDSRTVIPRSSSRTCTRAQCKEREIADLRAAVTREADRRDALWMRALTGLASEVVILDASRRVEAADV